ncbi:unnamed protein product [Effrenium voratum]|nr:unnamed protein product [Effrenium voratum]
MRRKPTRTNSLTWPGDREMREVWEEKEKEPKVPEVKEKDPANGRGRRCACQHLHLGTEPKEPKEPKASRLLFLDVDGVLHPLQVRMGEGKVDTSHCFAAPCMAQLRRVVAETQAELVISSSWRRFETAREVLAETLAQYGLAVSDWTTTAGGETNNARVDQILAYVMASQACTWAAVDDEDLAPGGAAGSESMMQSLFRQHFVRTDSSRGLDAAAAETLIELLLSDS